MTGGPKLSKYGKPLGRPKGAVGKAAKDLKGFVGARYGGSAALQLAALCLVTPKELNAVGGSMVQAQVAKALELVNAVRSQQAQQDEGLRELVREELAVFAAGHAEGEKVADLVRGFLGRVKEGTSRFGLREALEMMAKARADLLPYTDQKQPLAVDVTGKGGMGPSVVFQMGATSEAATMPTDAEFVEVFSPAGGEVSPLKSHDEGQAADPPQLFGPPTTD